MLKLDVKNRDNKTSLDFLRKGGEIPAICYGPKHKPVSITIKAKEFEKVLEEAGESTTVSLNLPDGKIDTLIHEVQFDPVTSRPIHVDFLAIDVNKEIEVSIEFEFTGISGAVKGGLGTLVKVLHEVEIKGLPKDMPHKLEVDISKLETVDDQILLSDIKLPKGIEFVTKDLHEVVAAIAVAKEEVVEAPSVDLSAIEVEKKGKKEEEGKEETA